MDSIEYAYGMHMSIWIPYSMQMVSIWIAYGSHIPHADFFLVPFGSHTGYGFRMDSVWNPYGSHIECTWNPYGFYVDSILLAENLRIMIYGTQWKPGIGGRNGLLWLYDNTYVVQLEVVSSIPALRRQVAW